MEEHVKEYVKDKENQSEKDYEEVYRVIRKGIETITEYSLFFESVKFNPRFSLETLFLEDEYSSISLPRNLASELIYDILEAYPGLDNEVLLRKLREKGYRVHFDSEIPYEKLTPEEIAEIIFSQKQQKKIA